MKYYLHILLLFTIFSCTKENTANNKDKPHSNINNASGFSIIDKGSYKILRVNKAYPNATKALDYFLVSKSDSVPKILQNESVIRTPIERIVVTSTTHVPMLEALGVGNTLIGFPNVSYISSPETLARIAEGKISDLGKNEAINTEILVSINPELVVSFAMNSANKTLDNIESLGIKTMLNGDWLETNPIGRAEWLYFFAALYEKEAEAKAIVKTVTENYNKAKEKVKKAQTPPTVLSGVLYNNQWNLPAGNSYVACLLKDANASYLWQDSKGTGSLSLAFETVYSKANNADFWIAPGHFKTLKELEDANKHYAEFDAFKNKKVFNFTNTLGSNGGVLYYELGPLRPDIILQDLIHIFHPKLSGNYSPYFFTPME